MRWHYILLSNVDLRLMLCGLQPGFHSSTFSSRPSPGPRSCLRHSAPLSHIAHPNVSKAAFPVATPSLLPRLPKPRWKQSHCDQLCFSRLPQTKVTASALSTHSQGLITINSQEPVKTPLWECLMQPCRNDSGFPYMITSASEQGTEQRASEPALLYLTPSSSWFVALSKGGPLKQLLFSVPNTHLQHSKLECCFSAAAVPQVVKIGAAAPDLPIYMVLVALKKD